MKTLDNNCIQAMDVVEAFGAYWPMSGHDFDDLPAFAKDMVEGIEEHAREEARVETLQTVRAKLKQLEQESLTGWALTDLLAYLDSEMAKAKV